MLFRESVEGLPSNVCSIIMSNFGILTGEPTISTSVCGEFYVDG